MLKQKTAEDDLCVHHTLCYEILFSVRLWMVRDIVCMWLALIVVLNKEADKDHLSYAFDLITQD